jgi:hypothetical protein
VRASAGIYFARQNMLSQVGTVTTNGLQQQTIFASTDNIRQFGATAPVWPGVVTPTALPAGVFPFFTGVRVFDKDYKNPRVYTFTLGYEQELVTNVAAYVDYTHAAGRELTRFLNYNHLSASKPVTGNTYVYSGTPFGPQLDEVMVTTSRGKSDYDGLTLGLRKRFSDRYQFDVNYVLSRDKDDDSNERDPFADRSVNIFDLSLDYGYSDRDIRHKVNAFGYFELPGVFNFDARVQGRTAQPVTASPRFLDGVDRGRNTLRKDTKYFSFDWRLSRPFKTGTKAAIVPTLEMFNTFNNANNINPLSTPALFDFSGFLRTGVGDPRQVQLSVKVTF